MRVITQLRNQLQIFNRGLFPAHAKLLLKWLLVAFIDRDKFLVRVWNIGFSTGFPLLLFFNYRSVNRFATPQGSSCFTCTKLCSTVVLTGVFQINLSERLTCCRKTLRSHHSWTHNWLIMSLGNRNMGILTFIRLETQRDWIELLLKELLLKVNLRQRLLLNLSSTY